MNEQPRIPYGWKIHKVTGSTCYGRDMGAVWISPGISHGLLPAEDLPAGWWIPSSNENDYVRGLIHGGATFIEPIPTPAGMRLMGLEELATSCESVMADGGAIYQRERLEYYEPFQTVGFYVERDGDLAYFAKVEEKAESELSSNSREAAERLAAKMITAKGSFEQRLCEALNERMEAAQAIIDSGCAIGYGRYMAASIAVDKIELETLGIPSKVTP